MRTKTLKLLGSTLVVGVLAVAPARAEERSAYRDDAATWRHAALMIEEGRETFRLDNFGNEDFWGGALRLNESIAGAANGGAGPGLSPAAALLLGLKVDAEALPESVIQALLEKQVDLDDPAVTLAIARARRCRRREGFVDDYERLRSVGITCALCHSHGRRLVRTRHWQTARRLGEPRPRRRRDHRFLADL